MNSLLQILAIYYWMLHREYMIYYVFFFFIFNLQTGELTRYLGARCLEGQTLGLKLSKNM